MEENESSLLNSQQEPDNNSAESQPAAERKVTDREMQGEAPEDRRRDKETARRMTVGTAPYVQPTAPCTRCSQYIRFASICLSVYLLTVPVPLHSTISRP